MKRYFSKTEILLWTVSSASIIVSFALFDGEGYMTLAASLLGVASLILNAKGNPIGQVLMVIFSVLYGIISYGFAYYGEVITYVGMTAPMAVCALAAWLKNPYKGNRAEVQVGRLQRFEIWLLPLLTAAVTVAFYFILRFFDTANLLVSTLSVSTSFVAAYLTFRRSEYFAAAYALNDIVLIILWTAASFHTLSYVPVTVCFVVFFVNDIYGFISWQKMRRRQNAQG